MSPKQRDEDGQLRIGPTWESLIDRQIREAMEDGRFDDLPHTGRPLPIEDETAAGDKALAFRMLRNAGVAPPWIETDKEIRALLDRRDAVLARAGRSSELGRRRDREEMARLVRDANAAIHRLNVEAPTVRQQRALLDPEVELARLAEAHGG